MKKNIISKICNICGKQFIPNQYHPNQETCFNPECQHKRQLQNQRKWRKINPNYFKYKEKKGVWEKKRSQYLKKWRQSHKDYFRKYRENKKDKISKQE